MTGLSSAGYATDPADIERRGDDRLCDAHVIPSGDLIRHVVPGGYLDDETTPEHPDDRPWPVVRPDPEVRDGRYCPCWPSVRAVRVGRGVGRVVVHAAHDGRTTGGNP